MMEPVASRLPLLIAGCGYIGKELARQAMFAGHPVLGLCQSASSASTLAQQGIPACTADLVDPASLAAVAAGWPRETLLVHCAASGRGGGVDAYRRVYYQGMTELRAAFPDAARLLFTSSTSVYPQIDGSWVSEASPALPDRETGRILRATEEETLAAGGFVVRLAGIYGPGRSVLLKNFLMGESIIDVRLEEPRTPDGRWVNQIHRRDAAGALLHVLTLPEPAARIFNASDSTPMLQRRIYEELSGRFSRPLPPEGGPDASRKRGWTHKRVSNSRLCGTGWQPEFPSWFDALDGDAALVPSILEQIP